MSEQPQEPTTTETPEVQPINFEEWIGTQDEATKQAYNNHITGLKNTVTATRQERDAFKKQLQELLPKAEKGSELESALTELSTKLEVTEKRAVFAEEAVKPEIGCMNPKAAWLVAVADDLFDRRGNPDWNAIKQSAPELFKKKDAQGNAGSGTRTQLPTGGMNQAIRSMAGRN